MGIAINTLATWQFDHCLICMRCIAIKSAAILFELAVAVVVALFGTFSPALINMRCDRQFLCIFCFWVDLLVVFELTFYL